MDLDSMISALKRHPNHKRIGMIASHVGIVRGNSLNGRLVTGIVVYYDHAKINGIINDIKLMPGIVDMMVDVNEGELKVGDDIMIVAVAGETREHVFPALMEGVNRIKSEAAKKKEHYATV
jgi:molybdopterin synthase catalytic subunit